MSRGPAPSGFKFSRLVINDMNKSAAMETIENRIEKKSYFLTFLARYL